jgi:transposase
MFCDERPFAGSRPPAALFFYSSDRKGEHPQDHLKEFRVSSMPTAMPALASCSPATGLPRPPAGACPAPFFDVHAATGAPVAKEALDRIGDF